MKSGFFFRCISVLVFTAIASFCNFLDPAFQAVSNVGRHLKKLALKGFEMAVIGGGSEDVVGVRFVRAKSFVQRIIKRERPEVSGSWRMCPST